MVVKYAIANVTPADIALMGQEHGLSGSVSNGFRFGKWDVEPTSFLELAVNDPAEADKFVCGLLFKGQEEAAYRTIDGLDAKLLHVTGLLEEVA